MVCGEMYIAKDKHDCLITNSDEEVLFKALTIDNNHICLRLLNPHMHISTHLYSSKTLQYSFRQVVYSISPILIESTRISK